MRTLLAEIGLSQNESKIYLCLLQSGPLHLKGATEETKLFRANALDAIGKLITKGLVSVAYEQKRRIYHAGDPARLQSILESRQSDLQAILPQLTSMQSKGERPIIDILTGREGLSMILHDEGKVKKTIHVMQSGENVEKKAGNYLEISRARRAAAGITMKIVYGKKDLRWAKKAITHPLTEARIAEKAFNVTISVYGDRTVLIFGQEPTILRIQDKGIARRFLSFFEMVWKSARII